MLVDIPPIGDSLELTLLGIVEDKLDRNDKEAQWLREILPGIIERLNLISKIAEDHFEGINRSKDNENVLNKIRGSKEKILKHLNANFFERPPFTIKRIAEMLVNPEREGYKLKSNANILKFFNSLTKTVLVYSSILDFPEETYSNEIPSAQSTTNGGSISNGQLKLNVPLVEIPWLKDRPPKNENTAENTNLEDGASARHIMPDSLQDVQGHNSPQRKSRHKETERNEDDASSKKRPRRNSDSNSESKAESSTDDDMMDISSNNVESNLLVVSLVEEELNNSPKMHLSGEGREDSMNVECEES